MSSENDRLNELDKPPEVLAKIRDVLKQLSGEERLVAEYIMLNYDTAPALSLVQLAEKAQVSPSAVVRFCDCIGCDGFHDLHTALAAIDSVAACVFFDQFKDVDLEHVTTGVFQDIRQMLDETQASLDMESLQQAVDAIVAADQSVIVGMGTSGSTAQEFAYRLQWIGVPCKQYVDPHRQLMAVTLLDEHDLVIGVSHSGRTTNVVDALKLAKECGATTMCITDFPHSPITKFADICLYAVHVESSLGVEMIATRAAHLAIVDVIMTAVALQNKEQTIKSIKRQERLLVNLRY